MTALKQLAGNSGYQFMLLHAVWEVNELQKRRVVQKLREASRAAARQEDRAARPRLQAEHRRHARGAEPRDRVPAAVRGRRGARVGPGRAIRDDLPGIELGDTVLDAVRDADAAVIVTEWPELATLATPEVRDAMARPLIIDGRNLLDPVATQAAGFTYEGIGRPRHASPAEPEACAGPGAPALMEALLLAGGKAERLGEAAQGLPKPLVPVAGFPLAEYTVGAARRRGRDARDRRVPRRAGGGVRQRARRPRRRDRGGRRAGAARPRRRPSARRLARREDGAVLALNGDELLDVDFARCSRRARARQALPRRSSSRRCARRSASSRSRTTAASRASARRRCSTTG